MEKPLCEPAPDSSNSPSDPGDIAEVKSYGGHNVNVMDWDGPDDPANPQSWPGSRKYLNLGLMSILTIISPLGSSMFAPGVAKIMTEFQNDPPVIATFVLSIYFLGFAFGPLIVAPLSELYGRVPIYHIGNFMFTMFTIATAMSKNIEIFITFRLLMGP